MTTEPEVPGPTPEARRCSHTLGRWRCVLAHGHREAHQMEAQEQRISDAVPECRREPRPDCGFVHELEARAKAAEAECDKALDAVAWQARQLDEALARAERAEENWKASQREAEKLGQALAACGVGVA